MGSDRMGAMPKGGAMSDGYNNPRPDVISCSALHRLENCPASWHLSIRAKELDLVPPAGEDAASGTRIHKALETGSDADWQALSPAENDLAERCQEQALQVYWQWMDDAKYGDVRRQYLEARVGITAERSYFVNSLTEGMPYFATGQADVLYIAGDYALVMDYKTGRGETDDADSNAQLQGLAAIVSRLPNAPSKIRVAIIQPFAGPPTIADHGVASLHAARHWLSHVHDKAMTGGEPNLGDWCQYCPARALCPAKNESLDASALVQNGLPDDAKGAMIARAIELPAEELAGLLKRRRMIKWFVSALEAAARIRLEKGEEVPGYELKEVNGRRTIEDSAKAAQAVAHLLEKAEGGPAAAIIRSCKISPTDLQNEIRKASGVKPKKDGTPGRGYFMTEKEAKDELAAALGDLMTQSKRRQLVEVGGQLEDSDDD